MPPMPHAVSMGAVLVAWKQVWSGESGEDGLAPGLAPCEGSPAYRHRTTGEVCATIEDIEATHEARAAEALHQQALATAAPVR